MNISLKEVKVGLNFGYGIQSVGRLALHDEIIYFQYDEEFLMSNLEISPIKLPLQRGVIELPRDPFEGLAGVFNDCLPDGWVRLLFDRMLRAKGISQFDVSPLHRLAYVGLNGMGALVYEPDQSPDGSDEMINLDSLATQTEEFLEGESEELIPELLSLNGSSAGARPKALIGVDAKKKYISYGANLLDEAYEPWIVKFPNSLDGKDAGAIEYVYALMAKDAGIIMPEVHLFPSNKGKGYFAVKRFDREGKKRFHMHTVSGLIHSNFRFPSLDYEDLLSLTGVLTKDIREVEKMYRLAVFNVMAHNRDDHAKNFTFLMDESGIWKLSPAYDLTFSSGPGGEQSTMVLGEGRNISLKHLVKLGQQAKLSHIFINNTVEQTRSALAEWTDLANKFNIEKNTAELINHTLINF